MIVYLISKDGVPKYVGLTKQPMHQRWNAHHHCARRGSKTAIACAIRKYGFEAFVCTQIASASDYESLKALEVELIAQYNTRAPNGYNITAGGDGKLGTKWTPEQIERRSAKVRGSKRSDETKARMSAAQTGKVVSEETRAAMCQRRWTDEQKRHIGDVQRGRKASEETREKMREARAGRAPSAECVEAARQAKLGVPRSEETKAKISATLKERNARLRAAAEAQ